MKKEIKNYLSLQEATKFCNYTQEYLSLRARQGKLKAVKFGRNWATTKEWLEEYLNKVEEYNNFRRAVRIKKVPPLPPENLPIVERSLKELFEKKKRLLAFRPVLLLVIGVLIIAGGILAKEGLPKIYQDFESYIFSAGNFFMSKGQKILAEISSEIRIINKEGKMIIKEARKIISRAFSESSEKFAFFLKKIGDQQLFIAGLSTPLTVREIARETRDTFKNYGQWVNSQVIAIQEKIKKTPPLQSYLALNKIIEEGLSQDFKDLKEGYLIVENTLAKNYFRVNNLINDEISQSWQLTKNFLQNSAQILRKTLVWLGETISYSFRSLYQFVTAPWHFLPERELVVKEELESLKSEIEKIKKEPIVIKRIEVEKVIEPIREITREIERVKEISKIDDEALKKLRRDIAYLEEEMGKRLYAPGGVISQTIYVKEPVQSPKIYQEDGEIVLQTVGSGNVILSAATGLQLYGQQVHIEATNLLSPLIYLASPTRIGGDTTITGGVNIGGTLEVGSGANISGNLSVAGALSVSGDINVTGAQNYSGPATFTASSTSPVLKVIQNGSGNIVQFMDGGEEVFTISDGGYITLATSPTSLNPAFLFESHHLSTNWSTGTPTFFGINATSGFNGYFLDFQQEGTSLFRVASDGSLVANATITAASFLSADSDSTVRKSGEEVLREIVPIFRYDIPAQTSTTTYYRVSKYFATNPLASTPQPLPGTSRVYKLIIKYADDISSNSSSSWRIWRPTNQATSSTFTLIGQNLSSLVEGLVTTTDNLTIPETDWQVEVKVPANKTIRIFQIFLAAFDKIN